MSTLLATCVAEFFGTMILILIGTGVVAMVVLFGGGHPGEVVNGGFTNITFAWGLGVTLGVYVAGKISGAHLNPAVTLALAIFRGFPWSRVAPYMPARRVSGHRSRRSIDRGDRPSACASVSWRSRSGRR